MFITQRAPGGEKVHKTVRLPRIDSAKGVEAVTQSSQSTELLLANKQMAEVQGQLEQKKIEFSERMAKCKEREDHLAHKQSKLTAEAAKFQLFLKENDAKRARALKRAGEEANMRKVKEKEAEGLREEMGETNVKLEQSKVNLEAGLVYQSYLEKVAEFSEDFTEIGDILKRYETLVATNADLQVKVQQNNEETERLRLQLAQLTKKLQNEVLVQSSVIAEHQERLERAKIDTNAEELVKEQREDAAKSRIREIGEATMAIFNLYNRCRLTHLSESRPKQEARDVMVALRYIDERIRDLASIVSEGHAAGLVGDRKVREAVVDRQFANPQKALGGGLGGGLGDAAAGKGGAKARRPPAGAKAGPGTSQAHRGGDHSSSNNVQDQSLSGLLNPQNLPQMA